MNLSENASAPQQPPFPRRARMGFFKRVLLLSVGVLAALSVPSVFRGVVWAVLQEEAWRQGGRLVQVQIDGSLWQPLLLNQLKVVLPCGDGGLFEFAADRLEIECHWKALLERVGNPRFFERVRVRGGRVSWDMREAAERNAVAGPSHSLKLGQPMRLPLPSWLDLQFSQVSVRSGKLAFQSENVGLTLSESAPGELSASKMEVQLGTWVKGFRDVRGKTSLQGGRVQLGEAVLMEGLRISSLSAALSQVAAGRVDFDLQADAFGGELRVLAQSNAAASETPFEASGTFSKLGVAPLAAFLNVTEAAGGVLEAGKFSFRGQPAHPSRGTASLRVEAKNFQWETRQWDSLVMGATLLDHRIQIPEFALRQGQNQLVINGDMQWPGGDLPWWKADFGMNVNVRVNNLTELSALILPEFKYAAGGLTVDGAVRSQAGVFGGALIVSGANLTWRSAPIEELHAAIKLQGAEIQLLNVELTQGSDMLRGKGALSVGENWSYRGDLHGSVKDIKKYAALLQTAIASQPYSGGLEWDWSGSGSAAEHSGTVRAQFQRLLPVKKQEMWLNPMSGGFSAVYGKDGVEVENLSLGDEQVQFKTSASFGKLGARLLSLSVSQGRGVVLEGDATLPPEIWKAWPQVNWMDVFKSSSPVQLRLHSTGTSLALLGRLPGMPRGLEGTLDGNWEMGGTIRALEGKGSLKLKDAAWAVGAGRVSEVGADLSWKDRSVLVERLTWRAESGVYQGSGSVLWKEDADPHLQISAACEKAVWSAPFGMRFPLVSSPEGQASAWLPVNVSGRAAWQLKGDLLDPALTGEIKVKDINFGGVPDVRSLWRDMAPSLFSNQRSENRFFRDWKLMLEVNSGDGASVTGTTGAANVELKAFGTAGKPEWAGEVRLALRGAAAGVFLEVVPLVLKFTPAEPLPELEVRAHGTVEKGAFSASALGPLGNAVREYEAEPPLSPETVRGVFEAARGW